MSLPVNTVGSGQHPLFVNERTSTEVSAIHKKASLPWPVSSWSVLTSYYPASGAKCGSPTHLSTGRIIWGCKHKKPHNVLPKNFKQYICR